MAATKQATYSGNAVAAADGATVALTFDTLDQGVELLNRADPSNPTFIAAGTYAVTATFYSTASLSSGGRVAGTLGVGDAVALQSSVVPQDGVSVALSAKADAGGSLLVQVANRDGASARDLALYTATIVKLA